MVDRWRNIKRLRGWCWWCLQKCEYSNAWVRCSFEKKAGRQRRQRLRGRLESLNGRIAYACTLTHSHRKTRRHTRRERGRERERETEFDKKSFAPVSESSLLFSLWQLNFSSYFPQVYLSVCEPAAEVQPTAPLCFNYPTLHAPQNLSFTSPLCLLGGSPKIILPHRISSSSAHGPKLCLSLRQSITQLDSVTPRFESWIYSMRIPSEGGPCPRGLPSSSSPPLLLSSLDSHPSSKLP